MSTPTANSTEAYSEWLETAAKYQTKNGHKFSVKDGDTVEFLFLRWDDHWEFDFPCVMAAPVFKYNPNGESAESWIEEIAADLGDMGSIGSHDEDGKFSESEWRHWPTPKRFKAIIRERLRGKTTWTKWDAIAHRFMVKFTWNQEDGWLDFKIVEQQEA